MDTLKLYGISARIAPFTGDDQTGLFFRNVARVFNENKIDVRLLMSKFGFISDRKYILREVIRLREIPVKIGDEIAIPSVKSAFIPDTKVQVYFVVYPELFKKFTMPFPMDFNPGTYKQFDDCMILMNYIALETLRFLYWQPDLMFVTNWHAALSAILLKNSYNTDEWYHQTRSVLLLSTDHSFQSFSQESLDLFHTAAPGINLSDPMEYFKAAVKASSAVILLENSGENKLTHYLEDADVQALLNEKGEHFTSITIENDGDEEYWGQTAKTFYEILDKI